MKTIKRNGVVKRVSDREAEHLTKQGWNYCPKNEWKSINKSEPKKKVEVETETTEVSDNMSDKKKRKLRKENKKKKYESN